MLTILFFVNRQFAIFVFFYPAPSGGQVSDTRTLFFFNFRFSCARVQPSLYKKNVCRKSCKMTHRRSRNFHAKFQRIIKSSGRTSRNLYGVRMYLCPTSPVTLGLCAFTHTRRRVARHAVHSRTKYPSRLPCHKMYIFIKKTSGLFFNSQSLTMPIF